MGILLLLLGVGEVGFRQQALEQQARAAATAQAYASATAQEAQARATATALIQALPVLAGTPLPRPVAAISPENANRVMQLARWGKGTAYGVTYSPDGRLLAVASSLGIYLYDAETLAEVRFIETDAWISSMAFSPDGTLLASASQDGTVRLWGIP